MLTALTPVSKTVLHRFASTTAPHSAVPQLNSICCVVHFLRSAVRHTHTDSPWHDCELPLALNVAQCMFGIFSSYLSQRWSCMICESWLSVTRHFAHFLVRYFSGIAAALTSEASWVAILLGSFALCYNTGLFISPSGISELDYATTKTDTAKRSISIGRESLQFFFGTRCLGVLPGSTARG